MLFTQTQPAGAIAEISEAILSELRRSQKVLWLISGGSAVEVQVKVMEQLINKGGDFIQRLTIMPIDERFGVQGHKDSNSEQMRRAGFYADTASWHDVLIEGSVGDTLIHYKDLTVDALEHADIVIATMGLGADGHTAGILPHSPAATDKISSIIAYDWTDFKRLTLGLSSLSRINSAYVLAYGNTKLAALKRLRDNDELLIDMPAKLLYDIPDVTVYNDYITSGV